MNFAKQRLIFRFGNEEIEADISSPADISIAVRDSEIQLNAFYLPPARFEAFSSGGFIGSVSAGGSCNVNNVFFNPHGNGTHTECVGHISKERISINDCLKNFLFPAQLISVKPETTANGDRIITSEMLESLYDKRSPSLILRTLPNDEIKVSRHYSGTNPAYLHAAAAAYLRDAGIIHFLTDLPSVDKEDDGGRLSAHHEFWNYPGNPRMNATITELVYVPDNIPDGRYLLNLQVASFENDASPSRPVLYPICFPGKPGFSI